VHGILQKTQFEHDDVMTYLASSGHSVADAERLYGRWVPAYDWKELMVPTPLPSFRNIGDYIADTGIVHPPLYFWLLRLWSIPFEVHLWSGPILNLIFFVLASVFLFKLAEESLEDSREAAFVVFLWGVGQAVLATTFLVRSYDLLSFLCIFYVWLILRWCASDTPPNSAGPVLLTVTTALGVLTHYYFFLVMGGGLLLLAARLWRHARYTLVKGIAASLIGLLALPVLHPGFYVPFAATTYGSPVATLDSMWTRFTLLLGLLPSYSFIFDLPSNCGILNSALAAFYAYVLVLAAPLLVLHLRATSNSSPSYMTKREANVMFMFLWLVFAHGFVYVAQLVPWHAMGQRYLTIVWPFLSIAAVWTLRFTKRAKIPILIVLCTVQLISGISYLRHLELIQRQDTLPSALGRADTAVLIDMSSTGVVPRIVRNLPDERPVFVADQDYLLTYRADWIGGAPGSPLGLYVASSPYYHHNSTEKRDDILFLIRKDRDVEKIGQHSYDFYWEYYQVVDR
jgi:hypothetical protein